MGPFRFRGPGESNRALLMAATAWEAVEEMFLKKVVPPTPFDRSVCELELYMRFLCAAMACSFVGVSTSPTVPS